MALPALVSLLVRTSVFITFAERLRRLKKKADPQTASRRMSTAKRKPMSSFRLPVGSENICGVFKGRRRFLRAANQARSGCGEMAVAGEGTIRGHS